MKKNSDLNGMRSVRRRAARGVSLVELLVVLAIIGLLATVLLVAVQQSREASRRMQCANNLRQYGLAFHAFESQQGRFPSGMTLSITGPLEESDWRVWDYMFDLLPHLGVTSGSVDRSVVFHQGANRRIVSQAFSVGLCPSAPNRDPIFESHFVPSLVIPPPVRSHPLLIPIMLDLDDRYSANYLAAASDYTVLMGADRNLAVRHAYEVPDEDILLPGMFPLPVNNMTDLLSQAEPIFSGSETVELSRGLRAAEITDGLSHTLMMVEIAGRPQHWVGAHRSTAAEPLDRPWCDPRSVQYLEGDRLVNGDNLKALYSFHPNQVNVLFADNHVTAFSESVAPQVVLAAMTPNRSD